MKTILLPIDPITPEREKNAAVQAKKLADAFGSTVHLLSVLPDYPNHLVVSLQNDEFKSESETRVQQVLKDFSDEHLAGVDTQQHFCSGTVYREILRQAESLEATLIVVSAGQPELIDYLLGPNAAKVVRHAKCSVLVIRED